MTKEFCFSNKNASPSKKNRPQFNCEHISSDPPALLFPLPPLTSDHGNRTDMLSLTF